MRNTDTNPANLVDLEAGLISREIFVNDEIYELEQERVFARCWLFIGHESQVPRPGDYFTSRMGEESVIVTRDLQGDLHVLLNTCRHRGMRVCRYDEGNTKTFTCPYHGWGYSIDGSVVDVPGELSALPRQQEAYYGEFDKSQWGLVRVAQLENYKGSLWATWDPDAPAFLDYLGGMRLWLDALLDARDGTEGGSEVLVGVQKWVVNCNWKFAAENFQGDMYHGAPTHRSVEAVGIGLGDSQGRTRHGKIRNPRERDGLISFPDLGHGAREGIPQPFTQEPPSFADDPLLDGYFKELYETRKRRLEGGPQAQAGGNVFPNASFHSWLPRTILVSHPHGPTTSELWRWYLVDRSAPDEVKDALRRYYLRYSGPAGMTETDDIENWTYASDASRGVIARRYPYNYQQGLGRSEPVDAIPGATKARFWISEENARSLYRRWAQLMADDGATTE